MKKRRRETVCAELDYAPWVCTVTDSPTNITAPSIVPATATPPPATLTLGFLTILDDSSGVLGGYLLTNSWGRPLEFRLSTAVQPNRVQQILYGPTLTEYLHADLIGKTLIEKTSTPPGLIITDSGPARPRLRTDFGLPDSAPRPLQPCHVDDAPTGHETARTPGTDRSGGRSRRTVYPHPRGRG